MSHTITAAHTRDFSHTRPRNRGLSRAESALLALLALALSASAALGAQREARASIDTQTHRVQSGETLWDLASRNPVPGYDTPRTADLIAELNHLDGSTLRAGSTILIPVTASGADLAMR